MKNPHYEELKRRAKSYHRTSSSQTFESGIIVRHVYDEKNPLKISWWDDVGFVLNDYIVNVAWRHPRFIYKDEADNQAMDICRHLRRSEGLSDIFSDATADYIKVGRSRKKIVSYTTNPKRNDEFYIALQEEEARIAKDPLNGIVITPSMTSEWTNWSRFVSICAPIEVRNVSDLHKLADLTRRLLKRETSLESEFPGYTYTQADWEMETEGEAPIGNLSHAVNV